MAMDKGLVSGSTTMLIMKLLEQEDMYGYRMIEQLAQRSDQTFALKAGTLYPLLHGLEREGLVTAYDQTAEGGRQRKYYHLTDKGRRQLQQKQAEWTAYTTAVNRVLGGACCAAY